MGANWSRTVRETRAPIASATTVPPFPSTYSRPTYRLNSNIQVPPATFPETRVRIALASTPTHAPASTPANTNRIIAFHSTASWKAFFEASKASDRLVHAQLPTFILFLRSIKIGEKCMSAFSVSYTHLTLPTKRIV